MITFLLGFALGWLVFRQPAWIEEYFDRARAWVWDKLGI